MAMIFWGALDAASDQTMATVTRHQGSAFRQALVDLIQNVAAGIISGDPTIIAAAEAAVEQALADSNVVTSESLARASVELRDERGHVVLAVDNVSSDPRLRGSTAPSARVIPGDYLEVTDRNGYVVYRAGTGGGSDDGTAFRETHIIPVVGQSNAWGRGDPIAPGTNDVHPQVFTIPQQGASTGMVIPAVDPLAHPFSGISTGMRGFAVRFARLYANAHPGVRVVLVPSATGTTGFFGGNSSYTWAPSRVGESGVTNLYADAIARVNSAVSAFPGIVRVPVILWHQGESDAADNVTATNYRTEFENLIAGMRAGITGAADAVFLVGQMAAEFRSDASGAAAIDGVHSATPGRVTRTGFAPAPPVGNTKADRIHFNGAGQWQLAASYWDAYDQALYNL